MERLNMDFKGPLPTSTRNRYLLTIIDEYSRFPFAFPCPDMTATTVIKCLSKLFSTFGMPSYIHTDQGSNFMSEELKSYLNSHNIATSRTTPYNPQGNGQIERYNGIIWKSVTLDLKTRGLKVTEWESVLDNALFCIRSLVCTSTNSTPHERMFRHARRTTTGIATPTWLKGPLYMRKFVRNNKYEPIVQEVELIHANPDYATVRQRDGKEITVSLKHLAPRYVIEKESTAPIMEDEQAETDNHSQASETTAPEQEATRVAPAPEILRVDDDDLPRRSTRERKQPKYLEDYTTF